jgi:hypothetical protein
MIISTLGRPIWGNKASSSKNAQLLNFFGQTRLKNGPRPTLKPIGD